MQVQKLDLQKFQPEILHPIFSIQDVLPLRQWAGFPRQFAGTGPRLRAQFGVQLQAVQADLGEEEPFGKERYGDVSGMIYDQIERLQRETKLVDRPVRKLETRRVE